MPRGGSVKVSGNGLPCTTTVARSGRSGTAGKISRGSADAGKYRCRGQSRHHWYGHREGGQIGGEGDEDMDVAQRWDHLLKAVLSGAASMVGRPASAEQTASEGFRLLSSGKRREFKQRQCADFRRASFLAGIALGQRPAGLIGTRENTSVRAVCGSAIIQAQCIVSKSRNPV